MNKEELKNLYEKYRPAIKETVETVVFVIVMVIIIRFFLSLKIITLPEGNDAGKQNLSSREQEVLLHGSPAAV